MAVPPIVAAKAASEAQKAVSKALTGDIYVRKWQTTKGVGKKKYVVGHEVHANPLTLIIAGGVAAGGVLALAMGGWFLQKKLARSTDAASKCLVTKQYDATTETVTIVDVAAVPAWTESAYYDEIIWENAKVYPQQGYMTADQLIEAGISPPWGPGEWQMVNVGTERVLRTTEHEAVPAVTHDVTRPLKAGWTLVSTLHGIPLRRIYEKYENVVTETVLSTADIAKGWKYESIIRGPTEGEDRLGRYVLQVWKFTNPDKHALALTDRAGFLE